MDNVQPLGGTRSPFRSAGAPRPRWRKIRIKRGNMEIFISWSGERGQALATILGKWLPKVIQSLKTWISASDIDKGARWLKEVSERLDSTNFGILCLTPENINEPWILFEAGALSKALNSSSVCPVLLDFAPSEIKGPLSQFQATKLQRDDMLKLLHTINKNLGAEALKEAQVEEFFTVWWPILEKDISNIPPVSKLQVEKTSDRELIEEILKVVRRLETQSLPTREDIAFSNLSQVLSTLSPREEKIMRMRYGIGEKEAHEVSEIATDFEIPEGEVKKIIQVALRKLRHPSRFSALKEFLEATGEGGG